MMVAKRHYSFMEMRCVLSNQLRVVHRSSAADLWVLAPDTCKSKLSKLGSYVSQDFCNEYVLYHFCPC